MADKANVVQVKATYDKDSKRYHRYTIDEGQGVVGNLYIPKEDGPELVGLVVEVQVQNQA